MAGDHLTARQQAFPIIVQHSLIDLNNGFSYRTGVHSNGTWVDWAARQTQSRIMLPRQGKVGVYLDNEQINLPFTYGSIISQDVTIECVLTCRTGDSYNFFGGIWSREVCAIFGASSYRIGISTTPINDSISDTVGRVIFDTSDSSGTRIASKTIHARVPISDDNPHHVCFTHAGSGTSNVVKLYVDGVNTETYTLTAAMGTLGSPVRINVEDFFTSQIGSISHFCMTSGLLSQNEIKARANLVNGISGGEMTESGEVMAWDATNATWTPSIKTSSVIAGSNSYGWSITQPPS